MKIRLEGQFVCSVCGAVWESYRGLDGNEPIQCASCGASPKDEDFADADYPGAHEDDFDEEQAFC